MKAFEKSMIPARPKDPRILERECREIMQPYIRVIADIYARSTFKMRREAGNPFPTVTYPELTEKAAAEIRQLMNAQIEQHILNSGYGQAEIDHFRKGKGKEWLNSRI